MAKLMKVTNSADDRIDVTQLIHRYCDALTRHDWNMLADCYVEEAVWYEKPPLDLRLNGRDEIIATVKSMVERMKYLVFMPHSIVVDLAGEVGHVRTVIHEVGRTGDDTEDMIVYGLYEDDVVKRDGRWYFINRVFGPLQYQLPRNLREHLLD